MESKRQPRRALLRAAERLSQRLGRYLSEEMERLQVTDLEAHVLLHLPDAGRPVADLQAALGVAPSTLTGVIDRLEGHGYVRRARNPGDRRSYLIVPTARGAGAAAQVRAFSDRFEAGVRARVTAADLRGFMRVVDAIDDVIP